MSSLRREASRLGISHTSVFRGGGAWHRAMGHTKIVTYRRADGSTVEWPPALGSRLADQLMAIDCALTYRKDLLKGARSPGKLILRALGLTKQVTWNEHATET